jgi:methionine-rich copper-binding protein CopC
MKRTLISTGAVVFLLLALAGPAGAHGGLEVSDPEDGARLSGAPKSVSMTFTEMPSNDSVLKVVDGCRRDVIRRTSATDHTLLGKIGAAQPGKWKASYRVISAEDGHLTKGAIRFTVEGKKDCTPDDDGSGEPSEEPGDAGNDSAADPPGEEESDFPVVPVAVGAAGLLIVGVVVRRVSAG